MGHLDSVGVCLDLGHAHITVGDRCSHRNPRQPHRLRACSRQPRSEGRAPVARRWHHQLARRRSRRSKSWRLLPQPSSRSVTHSRTPTLHCLAKSSNPSRFSIERFAARRILNKSAATARRSCVGITRFAPIAVRATSMRLCSRGHVADARRIAAQRMCPQHRKHLAPRPPAQQRTPPCPRWPHTPDRAPAARTPTALQSAPAAASRRSQCPRPKPAQSHSASRPARRASDRAWRAPQRPPHPAPRQSSRSAPRNRSGSGSRTPGPRARS